MKQITTILSTITLIFLLAACSTSNDNVQVAQASPSSITELTPTNTSIPTTTQTPTPEPTQTTTPAPTSTPTPTATPSPTPPACDNTLLREAIASLNSLDSYKNSIEAKGTIGTIELTVMQMDSMASFNNGKIEAFEATMQLATPEQVNFQMILVEDNVYFRELPDENWIVFTGQMANTYLNRFTDVQFLKPELMDALEDAECVSSVSELDGQMAQLYSYYDVNLENVPGRGGIALGNSLSEVSPAQVSIWLLPVDNMIIPIKFLMELEVVETGQEMEMDMAQELYDINVPVEITVPENVIAPSFFLDVPLPEDAENLTENDFLISFTTSMPPHEVMAMYTSFLEETGWTQTDSYIAEERGVLFEVIEYSREEQEVVVAVSEQPDFTIVSIAGGDKP